MELELRVPSIHCEGCVEGLRKALTGKGAEAVSGDPARKTLRVRFEEGRLSEAKIREAIVAAGHTVGG